MSFDRKLVEEVNLLRSNPKKYADKINKYLDYFEGSLLKIPGRKAGIQTHEGPKAYKEAINYLSRQNPVEPLSPSKALFRIAQDYLKKIQRKNADASSIDVDALIEKYGTYYGDLIHAADYGGHNPEESLIFLIVSDGDYNRRQRESLLSSSYKLIGGATGSHPMFQNCTVIFTCSEFENSKDAEDIGFLDGKPYKKSGTTVENKPQPVTQSKYQPSVRSQPVTQSRYQAKAKEETQPVTQSKYQPVGRRRAQQETQPQAKPQTQSRYQPVGSRAQPQTQTQTQTKPKYQPAKARTQVETKVETRVIPQSEYQSKWAVKKDDSPEGNLKVISEKRSEKISIEGGKKVKETKIERIMSDGSKQVETLISDE